MNLNHPSILSWLAMFGCVSVMGLGSFKLADYSTRPGPQGGIIEHLDRLPSELLEEFNSNESTSTSKLILFYHPHCPCTRATIRELSRMSVKFSHETNLIAFAYVPTSEDASWIESDTTQLARSIPGMKIIPDPGAYAIRIFGAHTSGHILLYCGDGSLVFSGGITPGRGHEGNSVSGNDLLRSINGSSAPARHHPVFGCPMIDDAPGTEGGNQP